MGRGKRRPGDPPGSLQRPSGRAPGFTHLTVVTEGQKTEYNYFNALKRQARNPRIKVVVLSGSGGPKSVVKTAEKAVASTHSRSKRKRLSTSEEEVWCVIDVDRAETLAASIREALSEGYLLAISNPCFELWVLLHFQSQRGHLSAKEALRRVRKHLPNYDKDLRSTHPERIPDAIKRARSLRKMYEDRGDTAGNPSTDVDRLVEIILGPRFGFERIAAAKKGKGV